MQRNPVAHAAEWRVPLAGARWQAEEVGGGMRGLRVAVIWHGGAVGGGCPRETRTIHAAQGTCAVSSLRPGCPMSEMLVARPNFQPPARRAEPQIQREVEPQARLVENGGCLARCRSLIAATVSWYVWSSLLRPVRPAGRPPGPGQSVPGTLHSPALFLQGSSRFCCSRKSRPMDSGEHPVKLVPHRGSVSTSTATRHWFDPK